jgi:hypothetical protein
MSQFSEKLKTQYSSYNSEQQRLVRQALISALKARANSVFMEASPHLDLIGMVEAHRDFIEVGNDELAKRLIDKLGECEPEIDSLEVLFIKDLTDGYLFAKKMESSGGSDSEDGFNAEDTRETSLGIMGVLASDVEKIVAAFPEIKKERLIMEINIAGQQELKARLPGKERRYES